MKVEVFDDWKSLVHFACGIFSYVLPELFIVFLFYEIVSCLHKGESLEHFLGDLIEFFLGLSFSFLLTH